MCDVLDRLKILIESSTPIIVMETMEEMRAVHLVREASSPLNLAVSEWSIAKGLSRCGGETHLASGETEKRIHKVFSTPRVLWIDELEKVFAGSGPDSEFCLRQCRFQLQGRRKFSPKEYGHGNQQFPLRRQFAESLHNFAY